MVNACVPTPSLIGRPIARSTLFKGGWGGYPYPMKQDFDVKGGPEIGRRNLPPLRAELRKMDLHGLFIPHEDEYQNEYLPDANERLAWATGFTGSAGAAFVFVDQAVLFVDGRYTIQSAEQVDTALFNIVDMPEPGPFGWLAAADLSGKRVGYDPHLMTPTDVQRLAAAAEQAGANLVALARNPIDVAWQDRPAQPSAPIVAHPTAHAGKPLDEKLDEIAAILKDRRCDATILTAPASIAWAFNLRGGDVARSPLPLSRALLREDGTAILFAEAAKIDDKVRDHLGNRVEIRGKDDLAGAINALNGKTISLDPNSASAWFFETAQTAGAEISEGPDPVLLPKACKNAAELDGTRAAHLRDGVAVTQFLHWLDTEAQSGTTTEIDAAIALERFRDALDGLKDLSFDTISGAGPNGALPHYRVSTASNLPLARGSLYLVDSGGQYQDGTTDVTRTVPIGDPSDDMRRHYTLVLKGHIALSAVRFPHGTTGTHLDTLARHALWQAGLDYDHGTGHGVGVYLGVHEGPQRIAKAWNSIPLMEGMIVSNEPGYYREGAYGIRIENLQAVTAPAEIPGGERAMLGFETLTFAPLSQALIDVSLLSEHERRWVDAYHAEVMAKIGPRLDASLRTWLEAACQPL